MSYADLELHNYRLSSLNIQFNETWLANESVDDCEQYRVTPDTETLISDDEQSCMVRFSVRCEPPPESAEKCRFSLIEATLWGIFKLTKETSEEQKNILIGYNSISILHGIARGLIINATGGCVGGPFILPTFNYVKHFGQQAELRDAKAVDDRALPEPEIIGSRED